jgi:hypothetical protein
MSGCLAIAGRQFPYLQLDHCFPLRLFSPKNVVCLVCAVGCDCCAVNVCLITSLQMSSAYAAISRPTCPLALSLALAPLHSSRPILAGVPPAATLGPISLATASPLTATQRHLASCVCPPCGAAPSFHFSYCPSFFPFFAPPRYYCLLLRPMKTHGRSLQFTRRHPSLLLRPRQRSQAHH